MATLSLNPPSEEHFLEINENMNEYLVITDIFGN